MSTQNQLMIRKLGGTLGENKQTNKQTRIQKIKHENSKYIKEKVNDGKDTEDVIKIRI